MVCPFMDGIDGRCIQRLKLDSLDFAVSVCGEDFTECEVFWELAARVRDESARHATPTS